MFSFVQVPPAGAHLEAAASGAVDLRHLAAVIEDLAAGRKIRRGQRREQVVVRILEIGDRRAADLLEVEAADLARHTDGDAEVCRHEHVREASSAAAPAPSSCRRSYRQSRRCRCRCRRRARRRWARASPPCSARRHRPCRANTPCRSCPWSPQTACSSAP